jgi:hypothetical protein
MSIETSRDNSTDLLFLVAIGAAIYFLWQKFSSGVTSLINPLSQGAADEFVKLTAGPAAVASGNILLPDGALVPVNNVNPRSQSDGTVTFSFAGNSYAVQPGTDENGNWQATLL